MTTSTETRTSTDRLRIDFLFLDLATCARCRGTDRNLGSALAAARGILAASGTEVEVNRIHVKSAEQALELRFESSPTIRVNGRDVALELRESFCGSEACTDGRGESIACRVWVHEDREHTEPPVAMILDAILSEAHRGTSGEARPDEESHQLPENLERFFTGQATAEAEEQAGTQQPARAACCSVVDQRSCCDPDDKAVCCGSSSEAGCACR